MKELKSFTSKKQRVAVLQLVEQDIVLDARVEPLQREISETEVERLLGVGWPGVEPV